jgi:YqjK-like protein
MSRLDELARRRERLVGRAAEQRAAIAESLSGCRRMLSVADRGLAWGQWARGHPVLIAIGTAALVAVRPRLGLRWVVRALSLWRTGRFALDLVRTFAAVRSARAPQSSDQS